jgi:Asp-tRNA(Asn)/Glu-tRNA(Gln) amidotransferase C subunit
LANLPLTAQRAEQLVPVMDDIFQMLDSLEQLSLGEAAPAFAYLAKWKD